MRRPSEAESARQREACEINLLKKFYPRGTRRPQPLPSTPLPNLILNRNIKSKETFRTSLSQRGAKVSLDWLEGVFMRRPSEAESARQREACEIN